MLLSPSVDILKQVFILTLVATNAATCFKFPFVECKAMSTQENPSIRSKNFIPVFYTSVMFTKRVTVGVE